MFVNLMTDQPWRNNWLSAWDLRLRHDLCVTWNFCVPCNLSCLISDVHVHFYRTPICVAHMVIILIIKLLKNETVELDEWYVLVEQLAECLIIAPTPTMSLIIRYSLIHHDLCELDDWSVLMEQLAKCLGFVPMSWPLCHMEFLCTLQS
jgi:hypothetical protein